LGVLGWTPYVYYTCSPYEFHCACEGYFIKVEHQAQLHRFSAYRIHQSLVQKPLSLSNFWPLKGDEKEAVTYTWGESKEEAIEMWAAIKNAHGLK